MTFESVRLFLAPVAFMAALAPSRQVFAAPEPVLKLPFTDPSVAVQQGWERDYEPSVHEGIDYRKGKETFTWQTFEVVAAYAGELKCVPDGTYSVLGNTCSIKHEIGGHVFYTLYAHLSSYAKTSGYVQQGEFLGMAGDTGHPDYDIHLHFEVQDKNLCFKSCREDPYGLEEQVDSYPGGDSYAGLDSPHWWANTPPLPPDPMGDESCNDGMQNQDETGVDCGGSCPPCDPPSCSNGDRQRCWVECPRVFPQECVQGGTSPLLMGIETCAGGVWGACDVQGQICDQIDDACDNQSTLPASYECVDGTPKNGEYLCIQQLGINCMTAFYSGWPVHECPNDLCTGVGDECSMDGEQRACEVYCGSPGGSVESGMQTCGSYCQNGLAWGPCITNDACLP